MVAHYRASIETNWSPRAAFDYLSDFSTSAEWDPGVIRARQIGTGAVAEGTEFDLVASFLGREAPLTYRVVEYKPPDAVTFLGENATVVSHDRITFQPISGGTLVRYEANLQLKGLMRLADPLLYLAFRRTGDRALASLRRLLHGPEPGSHSALIDHLLGTDG